jgi:predicted MFS family arabinose efflux permease
MPVLAALAAAAFLSTVVIRMTDPLAPLLAHDLGVPASDLALLATAYALPYALFQLVLGPIGDRLGKLRVVRVAVVLLSGLVVMTALAPDFSTMVAARVLSGAVGGGIIPLGLAMVGDLVPLKQRQVVISRFMTAVIVGQITGAVLTGLLAELMPWRVVLLLYAGVICVVGLGLFLVPAAAPENPAPLHPARIAAQFRAIVARPAPRTLLWLALGEGAIVFGYLAVLPPFLAETRGLSAGAIGLVMAMVGGGGILYALTVPILLRFVGARRMTAAGGVIGGLAALLGLAALPSGLFRRHLRPRHGLLSDAFQLPDAGDRDGAGGARRGVGAVLVRLLPRQRHRPVADRPRRADVRLRRAARRGGRGAARLRLVGGAAAGGAGPQGRALKRQKSRLFSRCAGMVRPAPMAPSVKMTRSIASMERMMVSSALAGLGAVRAKKPSNAWPKKAPGTIGMQPASATAWQAVPIGRFMRMAAQEVVAAAAKEAASRLQERSWQKVRTPSASAPAAAHHRSRRQPKLNSTPKPTAAMAPKAAWWTRRGSAATMTSIMAGPPGSIPPARCRRRRRP